MASENALAQNNRAAVGDESAICECSSNAPEIAQRDQEGQGDR